MGFMEISAETRGVVYLCNNGKCKRFIVEETGIFRKDVQGVLKR